MSDDLGAKDLAKKAKDRLGGTPRVIRPKLKPLNPTKSKLSRKIQICILKLNFYLLLSVACLPEVTWSEPERAEEPC